MIAIYGFLEDGECEKIREESEVQKRIPLFSTLPQILFFQLFQSYSFIDLKVYMAASPVAHKDGDVGKPATEVFLISIKFTIH